VEQNLELGFILRLKESCYVISTTLLRLCHVNQPIHVIALAFSAHRCIFVILSGRMTVL